MWLAQKWSWKSVSWKVEHVLLQYCGSGTWVFVDDRQWGEQEWQLCKRPAWTLNIQHRCVTLQDSGPAADGIIASCL